MYFKKDTEKLSYANYMLGYIQATSAKSNNDYFESINHFKKAASLKVVDSKEVAPVALAAIGNIYLNMLNKPSESLPYLLKASRLKSMPNVDFTIALIYYTSKKPLRNEELAEMYLNKAYSKADSKLKLHISKYLEGSKNPKEPTCLKQQ